ncbi:chorismate mutase, partial [Bacteroides fragilis]|uniref:chorismate mutase n=1 Tax=Bacteroides fragilis TaxID=817 RepID=UPI000AA7D929
EVSRIPSVDISRRFDFLYNYQHNCTEQLTSKALPLLFISQFKTVDNEESEKRINNAGLKRLGAIHRGFSSYDKKLYRNLPQWHIPIELRRRIPELPIFCDPSHIGGKRELVAPLCQQAMDLNFDGLIVESHCNPDCAWSDASQQVTPDVLDYILNLLVIRKETQTTENLNVLRKQIDECDDNIIQELAKRMRVAREIGTYKKEHDITVLQTGRYNEILEKRGAQGEQC